MKNAIKILNPSYVSGNVRNIKENPIKRILILTLDSLSSTIPKIRDNERIMNIEIPITRIHEIPIPILIIETASYLATTPSIIPTSFKNIIPYGNAKNHNRNTENGITKELINNTIETHFRSLGYNPGKAKLRSCKLVIGTTIDIEKISRIAHLILIQSYGL